MAVLLHAADVSNLAKAWHLSLPWIVRLFTEQFLQGDREASFALFVCCTLSTLPPPTLLSPH